MRASNRHAVSCFLGLGAALATLSGCGDDVGGERSRGAPAQDAANAPAAFRADAPATEAKLVAPSPEAQSQGPVLPTRASDSTIANSMIIRTGNASIRVDSLEIAIEKLTRMAKDLGGFVANTQIQTGETQVRSATIEMKVPAARFEQATGNLAPLGKVEFVNVTTEDVGEEFVDVAAREANSRRLEERLVQLLVQRTGKLQDVLSVERELARVREEIERYQGRMRYLRSRVAVSTLTVTVHERAPIVSSNPDENVLGEAFVRAWRNFVLFLAGLIASLGWLVPLGAILAGGVWGGARLFRRARPRPANSKDADKT